MNHFDIIYNHQKCNLEYWNYKKASFNFTRRYFICTKTCERSLTFDSTFYPFELEVYLNCFMVSNIGFLQNFYLNQNIWRLSLCNLHKSFNNCGWFSKVYIRYSDPSNWKEIFFGLLHSFDNISTKSEELLINFSLSL